MSVWAVSSTRDEADILEASTRHMLAEVDRVLIQDHASTDATPQILARLRAEEPRLVVTTSSHPASWRELDDYYALSTVAEYAGATWIVPYDTDEFWQYDRGRLRDVLPELDADHVIAAVYEHLPSQRVLSPWRAVRRFEWDKVAVRAGLRFCIGHHEAIGGRRPHREGFEVRHFPWRSPEQARRRCARNAANPDIDPGNLRIYRGLDEALADPDVLADWWEAMCRAEPVVLDPLRLHTEGGAGWHDAAPGCG